jgi:hypothetical protein
MCSLHAAVSRSWQKLGWIFRRLPCKSSKAQRQLRKQEGLLAALTPARTRVGRSATSPMRPHPFLALLTALVSCANPVAGERPADAHGSSDTISSEDYFAPEEASPHSTTASPPRPTDEYAHHALAMLRALSVTSEPSAATSARYGPGPILAVQSLAEQMLSVDALPALLRDTNVLASLGRLIHPPGAGNHAPLNMTTAGPESASLALEPAFEDANLEEEAWLSTAAEDAPHVPLHPSPCPSLPAELTATEAPATLNMTTAGPESASLALEPAFEDANLEEEAWLSTAAEDAPHVPLHPSPCPSPPAELTATEAPATLNFTSTGVTGGGGCGWLVRCADAMQNGSVLLFNFTKLTLGNRTNLWMTSGAASPRYALPRHTLCGLAIPHPPPGSHGQQGVGQSCPLVGWAGGGQVHVSS